MNKAGYINVDELQSQTTLNDAVALCGVSLDVKGSGKEVRIDCPFGCGGDHCGRKELAINIENPQKVFLCHAYSCKFRGNLLTLMHGWLNGTKPSGDKLKGREFQRVRDLLAGRAAPPLPRNPTRNAADGVPETLPPEPARNIPLIESPEEKVRELHDIDQKFIVDIAQMSPPAASYVRRHPCLSPESLKKWRSGYLPSDGGGDKRGWSLRGSIIYPVLSEDGQVLAWTGRDVNYEEKEREFTKLPPAARAEAEPPAKHRFPKGFRRGLELFGQQASRLKEPGYREFIAANGILVVEGFNDVIGLDSFGIPAVGLMSNRMTEAQAGKVERWSRLLGGGRVTLMLDCDDAGDDGAKEALWLLSQRGLHVRLAWAKAMHGVRFLACQPEYLSREDVCKLQIADGLRSTITEIAAANAVT